MKFNKDVSILADAYQSVLDSTKKTPITEGIFSSTPKQPEPQHVFKTKINYSGDAEIIRTADGWKVLLFDPSTKTMKPAEEVLGEMEHNKHQSDIEQNRKAMGGMKNKLKPDIDLAAFDKYQQ